MDADDLVSEAWEKIVQALLSVPLKDRRHFYNLACQHMRWLLNKLVTKYRREKLNNHLGESTKQDLLQQIPEKTSSSRSRRTFLSPEYLLYLGEAMDHLSSEDREILTLSDWFHVEKEQIADQLGIHRNTVTNRLKKIKVCLRKDIQRLAQEASVSHG
jgi:RNA polymerase sigma factor (sigma-70 family)